MQVGNVTANGGDQIDGGVGGGDSDESGAGRGGGPDGGDGSALNGAELGSAQAGALRTGGDRRSAATNASGERAIWRMPPVERPRPTWR